VTFVPVGEPRQASLNAASLLARACRTELLQEGSGRQTTCLGQRTSVAETSEDCHSQSNDYWETTDEQHTSARDFVEDDPQEEDEESEDEEDDSSCCASQTSSMISPRTTTSARSSLSSCEDGEDKAKDSKKPGTQSKVCPCRIRDTSLQCSQCGESWHIDEEYLNYHTTSVDGETVNCNIKRPPPPAPHPLNVIMQHVVSQHRLQRVVLGMSTKCHDILS
jgi:hypothetical protein